MSSTATQFKWYTAREFEHLKCRIQYSRIQALNIAHNNRIQALNIAQPPRNKLAYKNTLTVMKSICNRRGTMLW